MKKDFTDEEDGEYYSYEEMIDEIIPYVVENGFSHIELMPLIEFHLMDHGDIRRQDILVQQVVMEILNN